MRRYEAGDWVNVLIFGVPLLGKIVNVRSEEYSWPYDVKLLGHAGAVPCSERELEWADNPYISGIQCLK